MAKPVLNRPALGAAIYLLPNLITTGNLFFGFLSVVASLQGKYVWAAASIFLASIFDVLDGRVARLTKTSSEFGVQYDSLCDLISFCLAPAILMYQYNLDRFGRIGWILCFVFLACGALRLARFNVQSSIGKANGDFTGLPTPMAGAVPASFIALSMHLKEPGPLPLYMTDFISPLILHPDVQTFALLILAPCLAFLMVSNVTFRSHKSLKIRGIKPFRLLVLFILIVGLIAYEPELLSFIIFFGYAMTGPLEWLLGWKKAVEDDDIFNSDEEETQEEH
jgi:CDP-diacylglycerol--serine O-phosphatidyltransferase